MSKLRVQSFAISIDGHRMATGELMAAEQDAYYELCGYTLTHGEPGTVSYECSFLTYSWSQPWLSSRES
jgi:hypothetical protein